VVLQVVDLVDSFLDFRNRIDINYMGAWRMGLCKGVRNRNFEEAEAIN